MELIRDKLELLRVLLNEQCSNLEPWQIVSRTAAITLIASYVYSQATHKTPFSRRAKKWVFRQVRRLPMVRNQIESEMVKLKDSFEEELLTPSQELADHSHLPQRGMPKEELLQLTKKYLDVGEFHWSEGTQSGTVYNCNDDLTQLMTEVYGMAAWTNPLHPDSFPGLRQMEAEVVRIACRLFQGGPDSCGTVTSGGTESIVLACKAYRDYARNIKGIENPVMVVPVTAHAAFDKAADLLDITIKHVPVDPITQRVDIKAMRRAISGRTCLLVGSSPQFPHGSIDDITAIGKLGLDYDIPVHVDACLGGFLVVFMKQAGFNIRPFDFSVPGVCSISADTHKYGYAPKGSSVILYSKPVFRHYQWFTCPDWPGGVYATATIGGSRAGGIIAACWAALMYHGMDGYVECTKKVITTTRYIAEEIRKIKGIKVMGVPEVSVVAIGSDDFNIYALSDAMKKRGWNLNALQFPACLHLCCTMLHTKEGVANRFIQDVKELTGEILANPEEHKGGSAAIYGMAQSLPDRNLVNEITWIYLDSLYAIKKK
ncbi:sphingosine-1-phosphate lyase-like [Tigriopus californicus]|uniref:sphingosine-1-phosphate lyase-like n=1 Tax=Tigriopus californicus TaxID=6832 RepID=UPI0027DA140F|nr:sphingosine-1-phosphate lyase-like [Tigriopus californicus]